MSINMAGKKEHITHKPTIKGFLPQPSMKLGDVFPQNVNLSKLSFAELLPLAVGHILKRFRERSGVEYSVLECVHKLSKETVQSAESGVFDFNTIIEFSVAYRFIPSAVIRESERRVSELQSAGFKLDTVVTRPFGNMYFIE